MSKQPEGSDKAVEQWKIKRLIQNLEAARGNGTSMISLMIPPKDQISRSSRMLTEEMGTAVNIKSRVNRQSVVSAITSTQQKLKGYKQVPPNGLVIFCGNVINEEGKEKKVTIAFEPFKPINRSLYLCDNKFHVETLRELLESDEKFGFIVVDGNGCLFGELSGNTRTVLHKISVDLPKKHGRGGQSALRFARLRIEKRLNYIRKVAELAAQIFISGDTVNVFRIILAGSADFKNLLFTDITFDPRLKNIVATLVDTAYGGENGFNQAIDFAEPILGNVKFVLEKRLLRKFTEEISQNSGRYCFGVSQTFQALNMGAVETLIVWESLQLNRYELRGSSEEVIVKILRFDQEVDADQFIDSDTNERLEIVDVQPLLEWLANNYTVYGCALEFVTDKSQEGAQFCQGFGGFGGILRYSVDFLSMEYDSDDD